MVIKLELLAAVHVHPVGAVTLTLPKLALDENDWLLGKME